MQQIDISIDDIRALVAQLDSTADVSEESLRHAMLQGYVCFEKNTDGRIVGMGWIFPRQTLLRKQAVIEDMIVDESYRGKGLGEKILNSLLVWAREQGVEVVELTTNPKRIAANNLYKKVGFRLHETNHYLLKLS
ncbi:GNAT family N-acetyltransferase [Candidatus Uhrbacteria bacterium]|nr:GNAT family N-acetyltransferase [Candidatus Uhrbacteria bacterium]